MPDWREGLPNDAPEPFDAVHRDAALSDARDGAREKALESSDLSQVELVLVDLWDGPLHKPRDGADCLQDNPVLRTATLTPDPGKDPTDAVVDPEHPPLLGGATRPGPRVRPDGETRDGPPLRLTGPGAPGGGAGRRLSRSLRGQVGRNRGLSSLGTHTRVGHWCPFPVLVSGKTPKIKDENRQVRY